MDTLPSPSDSPHHQADLVIRLVHRPLGPPWKILSCGVDTLDIGISAVAKFYGKAFLRQLLDLQQQARNSRADVINPDPTHPGRVFPSGGKAMYQIHLQAEGFGDFFFRTDEPIPGTPDIYVSLSSKALWLDGGVRLLVERVCAWLTSQGFHIEGVKPSRVDVCMDFHAPGGVSQDFLDRFLCTDAHADVQHRVHREPTGFGIGSRSSPICVRLYDKTREIHEQSEKWWFWDVWGVELRKDVWRLEFELKRPFLHSVSPSIDTIDELLARLPDIWEYLTGTYMTFREANGRRVARRPVLPMTGVIVRAGRALLGNAGPGTPLERKRGRKGSWEHARRDLRRLWVRACALLGLTDPAPAMAVLSDGLMAPEERDAFERDVRQKRREYGMDAGGDAPPDASAEGQP